MIIEDIVKILNEASKKIDNSKEFEERYMYKKTRVPRTTEILSAMLHEDYLMTWANSLGFKRIGYKAYLKEAADKGTYTHHSIEEFLMNGIDPDFNKIPIFAREATMNGYESFISWLTYVKRSNKVKVLDVEKKLACKYFGGTLDCLLEINGKKWLIDFKTSNHVGYKYCLQLASYAYMLKEIGIEIDGCLILQLDKTCVDYREYVLDLENNEDHKKFFQDCIDEFLLLAAAYYGRLNIERTYKELKI